MKKTASELMWGYLLSEGMVCEDTVYGSGTDVKATKKAFAGILEHGIDWNATKEPSDDTVSRFVDTFTDNEMIMVIRGKLVLNNGDTYNFSQDLDTDIGGVFRIVAKMVSLDADIESIAKERYEDMKKWKTF